MKKTYVLDRIMYVSLLQWAVAKIASILGYIFTVSCNQFRLFRMIRRNVQRLWDLRQFHELCWIPIFIGIALYGSSTQIEYLCVITEALVLASFLFIKYIARTLAEEDERSWRRHNLKNSLGRDSQAVYKMIF